MVDFQERDTRRGLREDQDGARDRPPADDDGERPPEGEGEPPSEDDERPAEDGDDERPAGNEDGERPTAHGERPVTDGEPSPDDGEADIDEVRQQLEERPESDGGQGESVHEAPDLVDPDDDPLEVGHHDDDHDQDDHDHHHEHDLDELGAAVVTVSSSRTLADDPSGDHVVEALVEAGHDVVTRELIADEYDDVQHTVDALVRRSDVEVVVTTGGTGVTPDDRTPEAVRPLFEKELPGFGELFRQLSYDEIGTRIVGTRATAGIIDGVPVFCLPGSTDAVRLGVAEIIVEEAPHLAGLAQRDREQE